MTGKAGAFGRRNTNYKCKVCGQLKKGHTCPVTASLKEKLWHGNASSTGIAVVPIATGSGETLAGVVLPAHQAGGDVASGSPSVPERHRGGAGSASGDASGDGRGGGGASARVVLISRLLERLERRLHATGAQAPGEVEKRRCT